MSHFIELFHRDFIQDNRYKYLLTGLGNTLLITFFAVLIGIFIGFLIAIIRSSHDKMDRPGFLLNFLNLLSKIYLTVIRGTPTVVQLLISFFIIFTSPNASKLMVATLTFGINSGAYVAEIVRSGIMSIDAGQMEAGRSLGLNYAKTMRFIIMPQAFKNVLPALANEFIVLLKETSVCGYIGLADLTRGGDIIRSATYDAFLPLLTVAAIYLIMVCGLSALVGKLERRLRTSER
ncbi:amino acid ABC transporter permease [Novisyntrophococcus fermenticellae]|uniref:amino acid ABC transporter permease n=1 Tax=Novisyntrophococcus fermenticellae TaxID=2068655 RepID=UPI001E32F0D0|nr:amino acid ABC transporter permease [Novisyntrophococcus fermenticellae]